MSGGTKTESDRVANMFVLVRAQNWDQVTNELEEHSILAQLQLEEHGVSVGNFPSYFHRKQYLLQLVLENCGPLELVQNLVNRNPSVLTTSSAVQDAITYCATGKLNVDIVKFLLEQHPNALLVQTNGNFPLHTALNCYQGSLELIDFLIEHNSSAVVEKSASGEYPIEIALLKGLPADRVEKLFISFSDYAQVSFAMKLVTAAFKGKCSVEVVTDLIVKSNSAMTGVSINDLEKRMWFSDCFREACINCRDTSLVHMLLNSQICTQVTASAEGARSLLEVIYQTGEHLVNNSADGTTFVGSIVSRLLSRFPELAVPAHGKNSLHDAIRRRAPAVVLRALINANPAIATEVASYPVQISLNLRQNRTGVAVHIALHAKCTADVMSVLVETNPQCVLARETITDRNSTTCNSVIQLALDLRADAGVIEVLFNVARKLLDSPDAWADCLVKACSIRSDVSTALVMHILSIRPGDATRAQTQAQPVHDVIGFAPAAVILKLLQCNYETPNVPKAAEVQLSYTIQYNPGKSSQYTGTHPNGNMLLHLAVSRADVLQTVINYNRKALEVAGEGFTPIERALKCNAPLECVKILIENSPPRDRLCALSITDGASLEVCCYLFDKYPTEVDRELLQTALNARASEEKIDMIATLIQEGPTAHNAHDVAGTGKALVVALHSRYSLGVYVKVLKLLSGAASDNIGTETHPQYPLADALLLGVSVDVLALLLKEYPAATLVEVDKIALWDQVIRDSKDSQLSSEMPKTVHGKYVVNKESVVAVCLAAVTHNNAIFTVMMSLRELAVATAEEIIRQLFRAHPDWAYLCRDAAEKTKDEIRAVMNEYLFFCGRYEQQMGAPLHCSATAVVLEFKDHGVLSEYAQSYDKYVSEGFVCAMASVHIDATQTHAESLANCVNVSSTKTSAAIGPDTGLVSAADYTAFCVGKFGRTRTVVIKFMRDEIQFEREKTIRSKGQLNEKYVVPLLQDLHSAEFTDEIVKGRVRHVTGAFQFGLVMPAADRSVDAIFRSERPGINHVRLIMYEIGLALQHCHEHGIVHGDLKMMNVLRVGDRIRLIDMDAASKIGTDYLGAKFSSGVLPPELFTELSAEQVQTYEKHWTDEVTANSELWRKIQPRTVVNRGIGTQSFVVKSYRTTPDGTPDVSSPLPYALVKATASADIWAFGCMLYTFLSGKPLLTVDPRDDDLSGGDEYKQAASWIPESIAEKIAATIGSKENYLAVDLLTALLDPDAERRGAKSIEDHLQHPFFLDAIKTTAEAATGSAKAELDDLATKLTAILAAQKEELLKKFDEQNQLLSEIHRQNARIEANTHFIARMSDKMILQIQRTEQVMLTATFEASDVTVPSCFVILNRKMEDEVKEANNKSAMESAIRWTERLANIAKSVADTVSGGETSLIKAAVDELVKGEVLWLYLVDEYTQMPLVGQANYPIKITTPAEFVPKVLPLMKLGLKAVSALNTAASIARCLGYPVPCVPPEQMDLARKAIDGLGKQSSVEEYDCLQSVLSTDSLSSTVAGSHANSSQMKSLRGAALREFARFLASEDKNSTFSGLCRVATKNGMCCWTLSENVKKVSGEIPEELATALPVHLAEPTHVPQPEQVSPPPEVPQQSQQAELADPALAAYAKQVQELQTKLASLEKSNDAHLETIAKQTQAITLLAKDVPEALRALRTDIVASVSTVSERRAGCALS